MSPESTLQTILTTAIARLAQAGCDTPRLDAEVLLAHVLEKDRAWLLAHADKKLSPAQSTQFENLLRRREQREPVAYLTGHKEFYGLDFQVTPHVLIPRPETELVVETALQYYQTAADSRRHFTIVDVGTGSGCIAVTLAKHIPQAKFVAVDVSAPALQIARQNARRHAVAEKITFLRGHLLAPVTGPVDMIVSNPPYVSDSELRGAMPEVSRYEPSQALAGGTDGLEVVRALLAQAGEKLKPNGCLLVEIGASQGAAAAQQAQQFFKSAGIEIKKDLAGLDRLLVVGGANG